MLLDHGADIKATDVVSFWAINILLHLIKFHKICTANNRVDTRQTKTLKYAVRVNIPRITSIIALVLTLQYVEMPFVNTQLIEEQSEKFKDLEYMLRLKIITLNSVVIVLTRIKI